MSNLKKKNLGVAAQLLFDCQMEAIYHYEGYGEKEYLRKIRIARDYVNLVEQTDDIKLLHEIIDDCIFAVEKGSKEEYLVSQFQAAIDYIDNFCKY